LWCRQFLHLVGADIEQLDFRAAYVDPPPPQWPAGEGEPVVPPVRVRPVPRTSPGARSAG
jgi:hypothetical protein